MKPGPNLHIDYEDACADLRDLGPVVEGLIRALLKAADLVPHSVAHRIKTESSLRRKLDEKGDEYSDLDDVHDLLGVRIITFFPGEVDDAAAVVEREFDIDRENSVDKRVLLDPDRFGYLSMHLVAALNHQRAQLTEHSRFAGRKFEIQIRSILQHAWAEIEHDLGYQTPGSVPDSVRRRFSRLAGLLEVADDEFERLRDEVSDYQSNVRKELKASPSGVSVNRDSLVAFTRSSKVVKAIDLELAEVHDVPIYEPPKEIEAMQANSRVQDMEALGLKTIGEIETALTANRGKIEQFYKRWTSDSDPDNIYAGLSMFYLGYVLVGESNSRERVLQYLEEAHIGGPDEKRTDLAERVLTVYRDVMKGNKRG